MTRCARDIRLIFCHSRDLTLNQHDGIKTMQKNARAKSQRMRANKRKAKRKAWHKRQRKRANG